MNTQISWYIFDCLEIIMGPFDTREQAERWMNTCIEELNLLDDYPSPYVDSIEENSWESVIRLQNMYDSQIKMSNDRKEIRQQIREVFERGNK